MSSTGAATPMSCRANRKGSAFVYLEAMNYAKPCVGCFDDGGEEVIVDGVTGMLVRDPNDPPKVLQVLCTLLGDPERARRLGANGFDRLHAQFTTRQFQKRVKNEIRAVLDIPAAKQLV